MADAPNQCWGCGSLTVLHDATCPINAPASVIETRSVSKTGGEKGVKPQRLSLLPYPALAKISEVYAFGAKKYSAHNWRKGYEWSKSYDAIQRHLGAWNDGEDNDPESGLTHLAHAGFHIFTLLTYVLNPLKYAEFDDRHKEV